jgi:hypothetical protein
MINIYAQSFMTATRTNEVRVYDAHPTSGAKRRRWLSPRKIRFISPEKL